MLAMCAIEDDPDDQADVPAEAIELRQLRHHSKNALQRIIGLIVDAPALSRTVAGRRAADEIVRQVELSADISDALFGFTSTLGSLSQRLQSLTDSSIAFYGDGLQSIEAEVAVCVPEPSLRRATLLVRIAHELIVNALKHGMYKRFLGKLLIRVITRPGGGVILSVSNDGWPMMEQDRPGEGLELVRELVCSEGGSMEIVTAPRTEFLIRLPAEGRI